MKVFFFGCLDTVGHDLNGEGARHWPFHKVIPWGFELDGGLAPGGEHKDQQGHTALHCKDGWTAMSWWDCSGPDNRGNSNSAIVAEGRHDFDQMKVILKQYWPKIAARQTVELFL